MDCEDPVVNKAKPIPDWLSRTSFAFQGNSWVAWETSGMTLMQGAAAVKARVQDFGENMDALAAVYAFLLGLAIENFLKGVGVKKGKRLVENDRFERPAGVGNHQLDRLAEWAGFQMSVEEELVLRRLSVFVVFAGRYPVPTTWEQLKPTKALDGELATPKFMGAEEFVLAERIVARLRSEFLPRRIRNNQESGSLPMNVEEK
jgi:hypothetical protein